MYMTLLIIFLLISISLIFIIIIQEWNGNNIGGGYQSINATTMFFSSNLYNTKTKITIIFAVLFFIFSLMLGNLTSNDHIIKSKWDNIGDDKNIKNRISDKQITNERKYNNDIPN
uniref:Protein-export membrane protein SecG n=1 Tax=Candidatus Aschnera chinzeii TaxID=1485666 RepID=A0AAT9G5B4_9ENTR|nr:MAG: hypothetical protein ACHINZ_5400 [Candidatus Aschnera chinzeii]